MAVGRLCFASCIPGGSFEHNIYNRLRPQHCQHAVLQGINRLGKAAPKPGSLRPPDPNRRQDLDLFSEGAEQDADYMRMVNDV